MLQKKLEDIHCVITTFRKPISMSTPHTYISTRPFLPSQSPLLCVFSEHFTKGIRMQGGQLSSWPAPPLKWVGHGSGVTCMCYSPSGCYIISGSNDKTIRIWDAETGAAVGKPLVGHTYCVASVAYSPDGRHIISGSNDKTIRIWDAKTGAAVGKPLEGDTYNVSSVAYSPDGRHIISGSWDRMIRIWDAGTGAAVGKPLGGHTDCVSAIAYSPDGRHIISGSWDSTIRIWDAQTGSAVGKPLDGHIAAVDSVGHSPDGYHITSGSEDKTLQFLHPETSHQIQKPLIKHTANIQSAADSLNPQQNVTASYHNTSHVSNTFSSPSVHTSLHDTILATFHAEPDLEGWVRDTSGGLLYWVPPDCRRGLHSPALLTLPRDSPVRSVSLDFDDIAFGTSWADIFNGARL